MLFNIPEKIKVSEIYILAALPMSYMTIDKFFNIPYTQFLHLYKQTKNLQW